MRKYFTFLALSLWLIIVYGCKKKNSSLNPAFTSKMKSGTYVWMGTSWSYGSPSCRDAFTEWKVTVINDTAISVGGDTLPYISGGKKDSEITFGYSNSLPGSHYTKLSYNTTNGVMTYSHAYINSSGMGTQTDMSTAGYHRNIDLRPLISHIQGVKNMTGTKGESVWIPNQELDTTYNIVQSVTFKPLSDSTILVSGQVLGLKDSILYYKSNDPVNHQVVWQTHHMYTAMSTLTFNYTTNQLTFEQLSHEQWKKWYVKLQ